jgi:hypothetical protein
VLGIVLEAGLVFIHALISGKNVTNFDEFVTFFIEIVCLFVFSSLPFHCVLELGRFWFGVEKIVQYT